MATFRLSDVRLTPGERKALEYWWGDPVKPRDIASLFAGWLQQAVFAAEHGLHRAQYPDSFALPPLPRH